MASFIDDHIAPDGEALLEPVAELLGDLFCSPATRSGRFVPEYVRGERVNLIDQIRGQVNDKRVYAAIRLVQEMCGGEPYGVSRLGSERDAEKLGPKKLYQRYAELLATARMEVFYCGSAELHRLEQALLSAFSTLPRAELTESAQTLPHAPAAQPRYVTEQMDVTQGKLAVGFSCASPDYPALLLFNTIYGGSATSKLFLNVREKESLCYYASSVLHRQKNLITVSSGIEFENYQKALDEILAQLAAAKAGKIADWEEEGARAPCAMRCAPWATAWARWKIFIWARRPPEAWRPSAACARSWTPSPGNACWLRRTVLRWIRCIFWKIGAIGKMRRWRRRERNDIPASGRTGFPRDLRQRPAADRCSKARFQQKLCFFCDAVRQHGYAFFHQWGAKGNACRCGALSGAQDVRHGGGQRPAGAGQAGGGANAFTSDAITGYYFESTEHFEESLRILLSFVSVPYFTEESVAKEQGIIGQEIRMIEDDPQWQVYAHLLRGLYQNHPARIPVAGSVESIAQITAQTLYDCHKAFYDPSNMVLCVVGDVNPEHVARIADEVLPPSAVCISSVFMARKNRMRRPCPRWKRRWRFPCRCFCAATSATASPTGKRTCARSCWATWPAACCSANPARCITACMQKVWSTVNLAADTACCRAFLYRGGRREPEPAQGTPALMEEAERIAKEGVDETLWQQTRRATYGSLLRGLNSFEGIAISMAEGAFRGYDYFRFPEIFETIGREDLQRFLAAFVTPDRATISIIHPKAES